MFLGRYWYEKIVDMYVVMKERNVDVMVVNGLDEIVCKFMRMYLVFRCFVVNVF